MRLNNVPRSKDNNYGQPYDLIGALNVLVSFLFNPISARRVVYDPKYYTN